MTVQDRVIEIIKGQQEKGLRKYGVTVDDAELPVDQWIQHAQEELADCLIYLEKLKCKIKTFG
jgi:hypothetical protein